MELTRVTGELLQHTGGESHRTVGGTVESGTEVELFLDVCVCVCVCVCVAREEK